MKSLTRGLVFACCLSSAITHCSATILDSWHWRNPVPFANSLRSVCFGAGKFVAVGDGGVIHTSLDGITWDDGRRPVSSTLRKVIFANGSFIAVGHDGTIVTSLDGYSWETRFSGTTNALYAVTYGNNKYVACGAGGGLSISTDGSTWESNSAGTNDLNWVAFGNDVFVVAAPAVSAGQLAVRVSNDGLNWATSVFPSSSATIYSSQLYEIEFGNGAFVAAALVEEPGSIPSIPSPSLRFFRSEDGTNWNKGVIARQSFFPQTYHHRILAFANGSFYEFTGQLTSAPGTNNFMAVTADGNSLSVSTEGPIQAYDAADLAYANGRYVLAALNGKVWTSTSATNWTPVFSSFHNDVFQVIQSANGYLALASSSPILTSTDGLTFATVANSPTGLLSSVVFDGSNYVAVGVGVYSSSNAMDWIQRPSNAGNNALRDICRAQTRWVSVGESGTIITSPNGLAWTLRMSGTANQLNSVAFGNGIYVAVGNSGTVVSSPDGTGWDAQLSETTANLHRVRFLNGQFFAIGANGTILTSTDGSTWSDLISDTSRTLTDISYGDGRYVVCGFDRVTLDLPDPMRPGFAYWLNINVVLQSTNGANWENISTKIPAHVGLNSVAFVNGSFWLCGENGALLQSDSTDGLPRLAGAILPGSTGFQLKVSLNVPPTYRIQASTNLASGSWHDVVNLTNSGPFAVWTDPDVLGYSIRMYRIVSP